MRFKIGTRVVPGLVLMSFILIGPTAGAEPCSLAKQAWLKAPLVKAGALSPETGLEISTLGRLIDRAGPRIRRKAAYILGELGDPRGVKLLTGLLTDEDRAIRRIAASGLGKLARPEAVRPLLAASRKADGDPGLRSAVTCSVARIVGVRELRRLCPPGAGMVRPGGYCFRRYYQDTTRTAGLLWH